MTATYTSNGSHMHYNPFTRFVLWASGANLSILRRCPTDFNKMTGIGTAVILTSLLAFASGSYALWWVFKSWPVALAFGLLWMAFIFNIDRLMVLSIRKTASWKRQFVLATPRALIALMIGLVIAYPLELRMFQHSIEQQIAIGNKKQIDDMKDGDMAAHHHRYDKPADSLNKALLALEQNKPLPLAEAEQNLADAQKTLNTERGVVNTLNRPFLNEISTIKTSGDTSAKARQRMMILNKLVAANNARLNPFLARLTKAESTFDKENEAYHLAVAQQRSRNAEMMAQITSRQKEDVKATDSLQRVVAATLSIEPDLSVVSRAFGDLKNSKPEVKNMSLAISLLFIVLELIPVMMKLLMAAGPYDFKLEEHEEMVREATLEARQKFENRRTVSVSMDADLQKHTREQELNGRKAVIDMSRKAQEDLTREIIGLWKERQLTDIRTNIHRYIVTEESKN